MSQENIHNNIKLAMLTVKYRVIRMYIQEQWRYLSRGDQDIGINFLKIEILANWIIVKQIKVC